MSQPWSRPTPPVEHADSIAIWTYEVARRLAETCEVTIYARAEPGRKSEERIGNITYRRIPLLREQLWRRGLRRILRAARIETPGFASGLYYLSYIGGVAAELRVRRPSIVHVHNFSQFAPVLRALNPKVRIVLHMHCEWLTQLDSDTIARRLKATDWVIGCSDYLVGKIRARFPSRADRCAVVANGVTIDPSGERPAPTSAEADARENREILFVGRITPEKGLHVLLEAFRRVLAQVPEARLTIVGPVAVTPWEFIGGISDDARVRGLAPFYVGDYLDHLHKLVTPEMAGRVEFAGEVDRSALGFRYRRASVLANPSLSESFGMSLVEAMAAGVPVVASRVGGMTEVVEEGATGLLVEPGSAEELAAALIRILQDHRLRKSMGEAGPRRVQERFSWEGICQNLLLGYQSLERG